MSRNQLDKETSPYLLQHRDNPVHWRPWGSEALAEARADDKPILLSVGYAACHWCHVMAHESFEDPTTAQVMNQLYIPIKVDREERPDLDTIYQSALASLGQQGGWPLTMFLTPEGDPFWGGTYFPPTPRFGRAAFRDVLAEVAAVYRAEPDKVTRNVHALKEALTRLARPTAGPAPTLGLLDNAARAALNAVDTINGGLAGAPKFPHLPLFTLLWRVGQRNGATELCDAVTLTLDHMSEGGIYDHLGGGYARYATDDTWLVPHFEKMLYDNAQIIELMTLVWQTTRKPLYRQRIDETITWLSREMVAEHDAFAATLDADSEGHEGKYYVWDGAEIDRLLPADLAAATKTAYDVAPGGNWEGATILHRNHPAAHRFPVDDPHLAEARRRLLAQRLTRVPPGRDDKILADWNGMVIAALANAAFTFDRSDWLALAERAFAAIRDHLSVDDRLAHSARQGRRQASAVIDDYAQMARAAVILFEVTGDPHYLGAAQSWARVADTHYWDDEDGGYFFTADDATDLIVRTKSAHDHPTPSGNAVMVEVLARLYYHTGDAGLRQRAESTVSAFSGELAHAFSSMATLLNAWELLSAANQVVIVGDPADPERRRLLRVVAETALPNRVLFQAAPGQSLPEGHPAYGKTTANDGRPLAYLCRGPLCLAPIADPAILQSALTAR
jgi:hypothetical protein